DRVRGARFHAVSAEDTSIVIDVVNLGVALRARNPLLSGILSRLNIDAIRRTSRRTEKTSHTLLQAVFVTLQDMHAAKTFLKLRPLERTRPVRIVLHDRGLEHLLERDAHALGDSANVLD